MEREQSAVLSAIERWLRSGLIDEATAARLRDETVRESAAGTRRLTQYLLATAAAAVLLIAGGVLVDWAWVRLGAATQSALLAMAGVAALVAGLRLQASRAWLPAAYLLQTAGLGLLLGAFVHSEQAWEDVSPGGVIAGALSLAVPVVLAPRALGRDPVMPAVHVAAGLAFLAVFLDRATPLSDDAICWVLDAVLLVAALVLLRVLASDPAGERHPGALSAFVAAMLAGFVLIAVTADVSLDLDDETIWPLDLWLALSAALTIRGVERGTPVASRATLDRLLAAQLLLWIGFGFFTALVTLDGPPELAVLLVGGAGAAAFAYGSARRLRALMGVATVAFVVALWYWGADRGGALGGVLALAATAAVLFWTSGRIGAVGSAARGGGAPG
ncbi:MAG TPA: hypothetical protein VFQ22_09940 [Longimicrobiales bacterium]|nr:hypothetical protein [Longimicrobiales bacterium]